MTNIAYVPCCRDEIPASLRWDVPNGGQMVEVAYAELRSASPAERGAPYKRTIDSSDRSVTYYRREDVQPVKWAALNRTRDGLAQFDTRTAAERWSVGCHGHDSVFQVMGAGRYRDADGAHFSAPEVIGALVEVAS